MSEEPTARLSQPESAPPPPPESGMATVPPPPQVPPPPPFAPAPPVRPVRSAPSLLPHLIWEAVLLVVTVAVVVFVAVTTEGLFREPTWWSVAYFGLLASGLALSLRTGGPNLAVAGVATFTGAIYATTVTEGDLAPLAGAGVALAAALGVGLGLGLIAGLTSVPAWAVSLGGLALLGAAVFAMLDTGGVVQTEPLPGVLDEPVIWVALFFVVSLVGAAIAALPPMRRWFGARRDASPRFSGGRLLGALLGFAGSSLLAGLAGLASATQVGAVFPTVDAFGLLLALAIVLVAGVSAFGGRGGIAGIALAVVLFAVLRHWLTVEGVSQTVFWVVIGVGVLVGVLVNRLIEAIGPLPREE